MMPSLSRSTLVLAIVLALPLAGRAADELYACRDADGSVRISDTGGPGCTLSGTADAPNSATGSGAPGAAAAVATPENTLANGAIERSGGRPVGMPNPPAPGPLAGEPTLAEQLQAYGDMMRSESDLGGQAQPDGGILARGRRYKMIDRASYQREIAPH